MSDDMVDAMKYAMGMRYAMGRALGEVHVTLRAIEWLTKAETVYGYGDQYRAPIANYACGIKNTPEHTRCGVEDVRAMYLQMDYKVMYAVRNPHYRKRPIHWATCSACRVALDKALENALRKSGKFLDVDRNGGYVWRDQDNG